MSAGSSRWFMLAGAGAAATRKVSHGINAGTEPPIDNEAREHKLCAWS
jgi:hypothetical protein